jgi:hypothetical protein
MPIPNVATLYQRTHRGAEGGGEFARIVRLLLVAQYERKQQRLIAPSDASGDYKKMDAYLPGDRNFPQLITGFQIKFVPARLNPSQKEDIINAIQAAFKENKFIKEFILITPEDFLKEQQAWFDSIRNKFERKFTLKSNGTIVIGSRKLTHWGHTKLVELALRHEHIGVHCFPDLFPRGMGKFKLASAGIDCTESNWLPFETEKFAYHQSYPHSRPNLISDPVFDFQFTNSSSEILLLKKVEIHIEDVFTQIKGISADEFLRSIGTHEFEVDFSKPINTMEFDDPMVFEANKPKRFKLLLSKFTKKCPGNCAYIKFWFYFNDAVVPTESFYLSF